MKKILIVLIVCMFFLSMLPGIVGESEKPKYTFKEAGTYNVELNVYDSEDGVGIDYVTVTITDSNGDGSNDGTPDTGSGLIIFIVLIVIIVVVVVAVVIYVIKK